MIIVDDSVSKEIPLDDDFIQYTYLIVDYLCTKDDVENVEMKESMNEYSKEISNETKNYKSLKRMMKWILR